MKKHIKFIVFLFCVISITFVSVNISNANDMAGWTMPEKSEKFENWENLSEEKKARTNLPLYTNLEVKDSIKKSTYNQINSLSRATLASNYRRTGLTVKDQKSSNQCWAFAFSSALEGTGKGKVYSPFYLSYVASNIFNKDIAVGGNSRISVAVSADGKYPILETKMPFDSVYNDVTNNSSSDYLIPVNQLPAGALDKTIDARITNATYFASISKEIDSNGNVVYTNATQEEVQATRKVIKEHLQNNGPVIAAIHFEQETGEYYNQNTSAYFWDDATQVENHDITIVGWDDDYSVTNFNSAHRPKNKGAYIALNSYGKDYGDNGYIYISYDDVLIETTMVGIKDMEEYESSTEIAYDNLYQYDELGFTAEITAKTDKLMAANIFSRDNSKVEYLNEVGIFLPITEGVEVYVNPSSDNKNNLQKVAVETNNITPGYHIIRLANPVKLTGNKFVVAIKYINSESNASIPLEANWLDSGLSNVSNVTDTAKANLGESFISLDEGANWYEINNLKASDEVTYKNTNTCIKAYTTNSDEVLTTAVTGVTLNKTTATIKKGETESLIASVQPSDATNKNVMWTTSNDKVATVNNGVITGIAKGTATITVTTQEGNYKATCQVTVLEQEEVPTMVKVTGINLNKTEATIEVGKTDSLVATVLPSNATNKNTTWMSSDTNIIRVENGVVTAIAEGNAEVIVTTEDGNYTASCQVTVKKVEENTEEVKVTGIQLNQKTLTLEVGDTGNLVATITPTNATNKEVKWSIADENVAIISNNGIITAKKEGTTTITVTSLQGEFSDTCTLTVSKKTNTDDDIYKDNQTNTKKPTTITSTGDSTLATKKIPFAGNSMAIIISVIVLIIIAVVALIKFRILKEVK